MIPLRLPSKKKPNKYRAQPTIVDGIRFASKREAAYYAELKFRERAGEVSAVEMQKVFALTINGQVIGAYRPDFCFHDDLSKRYRVVDVKGVETREFKRTKRLMRAIHGIEVEVVK